MSRTHVPHALRQRVSEAAGYRCAIVRLFNTRLQVWTEHFRWTDAGDRIVGLTPTGRATVAALNLNRPPLVRARQVTAGWHPPRE